ncbi:hypothetical protein EDB83DRAFT_2532258 [Lactarius deliciosus]|nr:hypothetical protein EDB83DRAFT_2532258 [Lactarius deliciosus]
MYALAPHQFSSVVCQTSICFTCLIISVAASSTTLISHYSLLCHSPCLAKRKRIKSAEPSKSAETTGTQKAHRVTAGQGMTDMADSLRDMVIHMKTRKEGKTSTCKEPPTHTQKLLEDPQERVVAILEQDAEFSDQETLEIVRYFMANCDFARVYATFQSSHVWDTSASAY